jgi:uncharacterized protein (TIGR03067 family)
MFLRFTLPLAFCLLLVCEEASSQDADQQAKLEGTWRFVESSADAKQKKGKRPSMRVVFRGDTISFVGEGKGQRTDGTYTIDPGSSPKTMDITTDQGGKKVLTLSIYELDGDTLKLCHYLGSKAARERPKQFLADKETVIGLLNRENN